MSLFADVIVDISQESLDRPFQYRIPADLAGPRNGGADPLWQR